ncbi:MAG: aspartate kinase [Christensenellales bacterium]
MKVAKFGGSSLADAEQFIKVKKIIESDPGRLFIVPSAPGKRNPEDKKITDMLIECFNLSSKGESIDSLFGEISGRFIEIAQKLNIDAKMLINELKNIEKKISEGATHSYAASRGEYLNAILLSDYIGFPFVDAKDVIRFNKDGSLNHDKTHSLIQEKLLPLGRAVVPGFYGYDENGNCHVFSRGGSDVTGALIARGINADIYENWTDVCGFRAADPKIVPDSKFIQQMTYRELRELSYMGASVLHEDAVFPVRNAGIPTQILNTNDPLHPGTIINYLPQYSTKAPLITGIAGKKGFTAIMIEKVHMNAESGFGRRVLQVLEKNNLNFDHMPTGIDSMSIVLPTDSLSPYKSTIRQDIINETQADSVTFTDNLAMVAVVGVGMSKKIGIAARLFTALSAQGIMINSIVFAPNELSLIIGINEKDLEKTISMLYDSFMRD